MNNVPLHLERTTDRDVHGDLVLRLGVYQHPCDSYYFALDESALAGRTVADGLRRLLVQWREQLQRLRPAGGTVFLPFDLSDQCTAWLRVSSPDGARTTVQVGWSGIEGWSFLPSDFAETAAGVDDFEPVVNASMTCGLDDLVATVAAIRDSFPVRAP